MTSVGARKPRRNRSHASEEESDASSNSPVQASLRLPLAGALAAVIGTGCCAGLPALAGGLGGLGIAAAVGLGAGVLLASVVIAALVLSLRAPLRTRAQSTAPGRPA